MTAGVLAVYGIDIPACVIPWQPSRIVSISSGLAAYICNAAVSMCNQSSDFPNTYPFTSARAERTPCVRAGGTDLTGGRRHVQAADSAATSPGDGASWRTCPGGGGGCPSGEAPVPRAARRPTGRAARQGARLAPTRGRRGAPVADHLALSLRRLRVSLASLEAGNVPAAFHLASGSLQCQYDCFHLL
jgi:hypothetical protein